MSFIELFFDGRYIERWRNYRKILMNGWIITIIIGPIKVNAVKEEHLCTLSSIV